MEEVKMFIENLVDLLPVIMAILSAIVIFFRTGNLKKATDELKKVKGEEELKYRTTDYRQKKDNGDAQSFDETVKVWRMNKEKGYPVETDEIDNLQKKIDSYLETALDRVLAKYMPVQYDSAEEARISTGISRTQSDLDFLTETETDLEETRQAYGLDETATIADLISVIKKKNAELIQQQNKIQLEKEKTDEKKSIEKKSE